MKAPGLPVLHDFDSTACEQDQTNLMLLWQQSELTTTRSQGNKRGRMNSRLKAAAAMILAACVACSYSHASAAAPPAKKHSHKIAAPKGPTVEEQIQSLRQDLESQINALKSDLATRDAELKQAQQQAADAEAAAQKAQQQAADQEQAASQNTAAVTTL
jgi:Skp family chaperone for outer membrane proteins